MIFTTKSRIEFEEQTSWTVRPKLLAGTLRYLNRVTRPSPMMSS